MLPNKAQIVPFSEIKKPKSRADKQRTLNYGIYVVDSSLKLGKETMAAIMNLCFLLNFKPVLITFVLDS